MIIPARKSLVGDWPCAFGCLQDIDSLADRAIEVPDVDLSVVRAGVDVALVGGLSR